MIDSLDCRAASEMESMMLILWLFTNEQVCPWDPEENEFLDDYGQLSPGGPPRAIDLSLRSHSVPSPTRTSDAGQAFAGQWYSRGPASAIMGSAGAG